MVEFETIETERIDYGDFGGENFIEVSRNRAIQSAEADPCETSTDVEADHREQVKVGDDTEEEPQQGNHRDIYRHICINVLIFDERLRRIDSVGRGC